MNELKNFVFIMLYFIGELIKIFTKFFSNYFCLCFEFFILQKQLGVEY